MTKKKLVIFPFNGNGIEALDCLIPGDFEFIGFIDDDPLKKSSKYNIFSRDVLRTDKELFILAVPGGPKSFRSRKDIINSLPLDNSEGFVSIIHPTASIGRNVRLGKNCLVMAGAVITSNAWIGDHVCILPNSVIHHEVIVGDYTLIGSKVVIAGGTTVGEKCYIGSGSTVINGISIGSNSLIGMGSNVLRGIEENSRIAGNPAKDLDLKKKAEHF